MSLCHIDQTNCFEAPLHTDEALYHTLRDDYLPNLHILSKYLTAVLYNVLMAYFVQMCSNILCERLLLFTGIYIVILFCNIYIYIYIISLLANQCFFFFLLKVLLPFCPLALT